MATRKTTATRRKAVVTKRTASARKTVTPVQTRRQVISVLRKGIAQITFRKEDGTNRVMFGTLSQNDVPQRDRKSVV